MDLRLVNQVAVVTGASQGIGLTVARALHDEGASVLAVSRNPSPEVEALSGPRLVHVSSDLTDPEAPKAIIDRAVQEFGGMDILVNNAGGPPTGVTLPRSSFLDAKAGDWQAVFQFNLLALVEIIRAAIPRLLDRGGGSIINMSSVNARQALPMNVDYGAAKAAVTNLTKALSEEFAPQGIRVNTVSPGPVRTHWWTKDGGAADVIAGFSGADRDTVLSQLTPEMMRLSTGRMIEPWEVADVVALLASPRSASTTGGALKEADIRGKVAEELISAVILRWSARAACRW